MRVCRLSRDIAQRHERISLCVAVSPDSGVTGRRNRNLYGLCSLALRCCEDWNQGSIRWNRPIPAAVRFISDSFDPDPDPDLFDPDLFPDLFRS